MKEIIIFLDYDGTLSPIVNNPDKAYMSDEVSKCVNVPNALNSLHLTRSGARMGAGGSSPPIPRTPLESPQDPYKFEEEERGKRRREEEEEQESPLELNPASATASNTPFGLQSTRCMKF